MTSLSARGIIVKRARDAVGARIVTGAKPARATPRRLIHPTARPPIILAPFAFALALQLDAARPPTSSPDVATLVARARAARLQQDAQLAAYEVIARQRLSSSVGLAGGITGTGIAAAVKGASISALGAIGAMRLAARYESVVRLGWDHQFGAWGELIGARSVAPIVGQVTPTPERNVDDNIPFILPFYPGRDRLWPTTEVANELPRFKDWIEHPLAPGADSVYHFSLGDSLNIKLPDNRVIHLREIRVQARRPSSRLIVGSLWVDIATGNLVRAAYRPSVPIDMWPFIAREWHDDTSIVKRFGPFTGTIREIIVDHGLYEGKFWLPKTRIATGEGSASAARISLSIEQTFEYASVRSMPEGQARADSAPSPDIDPRTGRVRRPWQIRRGSRECRPPGDSSAKYSPDSLLRDTLLAIRVGEGIRFRVLFPCTDQQLLASLPGSIYATGEELFPKTDFAALRRDAESALAIDKQAAWSPQPFKLHYGIDAGMLRFNKIEGLSPGIGVDRELGQGYNAGGLARIGFADHQPLAEAYLQRGNVSTSIRGTVYRRLAVANDWGNPLGLGASISAAAFGRDDGIYSRSGGAELTGARRSASDRFIVSWRVFGEQQLTAHVATQRSLANVANAAPFDSNIVANEGWFYGASGAAAYAWGLDPRGFVVTGNTRVEAARWRDNYVRGMTELTVAHGFGGTGQLKLTGASGYSAGDLPVQRFWYVGGPYPVHAYRAGTVAGDAFWMGQAQIASGHPVFRPVLFSDIGWAGQRERFTGASPLSSAGAGFAALDGFIRFDVSRAIAPGRQWRLDLYFEIR